MVKKLMIKIKGRTPSKKNSSIQVVRNGKICHFPSNQYQAWHKDAVVQANAQKINLFENQEKLGNALHVKIFYPDSRVGDLTNKAESVMDLLVDTGFLDDDVRTRANRSKHDAVLSQ